MYRLESHLVDAFLVATLEETAWGPMKTAVEFDYQRGRTDIIGIGEEGVLLAFEAKLAKWREALHQAYRNTCFAQRSYVLLPEKTATTALKHLHEFERRRVGLCYVSSNGKIVIVYEPPLVEPIQPWLFKIAIDAIHANFTQTVH